MPVVILLAQPFDMSVTIFLFSFWHTVQVMYLCFRTETRNRGECNKVLRLCKYAHRLQLACRGRLTQPDARLVPRECQ